MNLRINLSENLQNPAPIVHDEKTPNKNMGRSVYQLEKNVENVAGVKMLHCDATYVGLNIDDDAELMAKLEIDRPKPSAAIKNDLFSTHLPAERQKLHLNEVDDLVKGQKSRFHIKDLSSPDVMRVYNVKINDEEFQFNEGAMKNMAESAMAAAPATCRFNDDGSEVQFIQSQKKLSEQAEIVMDTFYDRHYEGHFMQYIIHRILTDVIRRLPGIHTK